MSPVPVQSTSKLKAHTFLSENFANDYRVDLEVLRSQWRNQGHHRPVKDLDADEALNLILDMLQNWSAARRNQRNITYKCVFC